MYPWHRNLGIGIGIGIGTDTTDAIISMRRKDTKPSRVVAEDEVTLPTKSRYTSISWLRDK